MNILIFNWRDTAHPWAGGSEKYIHELAKRWVKDGNKVTLIAGGYRGCLGEEVIDGIKIFRIGNTFTVFLWAPFFYFLKFKKQNWDFVLDISRGIPFFTPLFIKIPTFLLIHHNHEKVWKTEFSTVVSRIGIFLENKIQPLIYKESNIAVLSESTKKILEKIGFKNIAIIMPGIDIDNSLTNTPKFAEPTILYLGRLRKYKRVDMLINLFPVFKKRIKNLRLIISGVGQDESRLKHLVRERGLSQEIIFKGFVSEDEKKILFRRSWVLAFPSLIEGWGLVTMEAAAFGTPTVGFKVPGVIDAVKNGETGILVDNKQEFEKSILNILTNKKSRLQLSKGAKEWAKNNSWKRSSTKFLKLMEEIKEEEK